MNAMPWSHFLQRAILKGCDRMLDIFLPLALEVGNDNVKAVEAMFLGDKLHVECRIVRFGSRVE